MFTCTLLKDIDRQSQLKLCLVHSNNKPMLYRSHIAEVYHHLLGLQETVVCVYRLKAYVREIYFPVNKKYLI